MKLVLFICTGNTCRSPMAAAIYNKLAQERGLKDIRAESAGLAAFEGDPASENAVAALREIGIDISGHRARRVTHRIIEESSEIICMAPPHRAALLSRFPQAAGKLSLLGDGIPDPYGGDLAAYRLARDNIRESLTALLDGGNDHE